MTVELERPAEQSRARYPDEEGFVERDGVRLVFEVYGAGEPTVLLLPTWSIVHSRHWKMQIPYLARHCRVVTFDGRGNGRSDRPQGAEAYAVPEFAADALTVLDATSTERSIVIGVSCSALWGTLLAADHPDRVDGAVFICPAVSLAPPHPERAVYGFDELLDTDEGWAKYNRHYWLEHYTEFLEFFFSKCVTEPHSTKLIEDLVGWGLETDPGTLIETEEGMALPRIGPFDELCARVQCPVLVIHGDQDAIRPHAQGSALAAATGGTLVTMEGSGHFPHARDPVRVNLLLREFLGLRAQWGNLPVPPDPLHGSADADERLRRWVRGRSRRRRVLFVSSPIGLGHARRDVAIADELRALHPDLEIDWLAQHPVTAVLAARGERIHPASAFLANESGHIES